MLMVIFLSNCCCLVTIGATLIAGFVCRVWVDSQRSAGFSVLCFISFDVSATSMQQFRNIP